MPAKLQRSAATLVALASGMAAVLTILTAGPAQAHAELIRMVPANGSTVRVAPTVVELAFDEAVQPRYDVVVVTAPDGTRVSAGAPQVNETLVRQPLTALTAAGRYTVTCRLVSADGHLVARRVGFTFAPVAGTAGTRSPSPIASVAGQQSATASPAAPSAATAAAPAVAKPSASRTPLVTAALVAVALLAGVGLLLSRRRQRPT